MRLFCSMASFVALVFGGIFFIAVPAEAQTYYVPCSEGRIAWIETVCRTQTQVYNLLPCGVTKKTLPTGQCRYKFTLPGQPAPCEFDIGTFLAPTYPTLRWFTGPYPTAQSACSELGAGGPGGAGCSALANAIDPCAPIGGNECPEPDVSGDTTGCQFFCEFQGQPLKVAEQVEPSYEGPWHECRAYALADPNLAPFQAVDAFWTIGRPFPTEALKWQSPTKKGGAMYSALDAENDRESGGLGNVPFLLGVVNKSPLWGNEEDGAVPVLDPKTLARVGLRANPQGAILGSPFWDRENQDIGNYPVLTVAGSPAATAGLGLYFAATPTGLGAAGEGAALDAVLLRLQELAKLEGKQLLCLTPELADKRRKARQALAAKPGTLLTAFSVD